MLQFLFFLIVFLIFSIFLLLALPYHYDLYFKFEKNLSYQFSFSLLFLELIFRGDSGGHIFFIKIFSYKKHFNINTENKITGFIKDKSKKVIDHKIKQKTTAEKKDKQDKSKKKFKFDYSLINRKNLNHIFKFIVEILKDLKPDYLKLSLALSFGDPYYNGVFLAYYYAFKEIFDFPYITVQINWQEVIFEAEGSTGGKIIPLKIIWQLLKFIFSIKSLKIFWKLYQKNTKKG